MQGLNHQQQQLLSLLAAALPKGHSAPPPPPPLPPLPPSSSAISGGTTTTSLPTVAPPVATSSTEAGVVGSKDGDSVRLASLNSLHGAIVYASNSLLVGHSASFLARGLSQLLSDKSFSVRQAAASTYGALCAVVCSIPIGSSGRQNHVMLRSLVEGLLNWALPLLSNDSARDEDRELALRALHEFLSVGDVNSIERYALRILKACQELLEDERTSMCLLHHLLAVLAVVSLKFSRLFNSYFLDIVDLLLGWVLVPDHSESERRDIMGNFLHFQQHWVNNLQFSLGLLVKFLGDMDVLLKDGSQGTTLLFPRLLALLSCFSTILQATASGLLELNLLDQIGGSLSNMVPQLLGCLSIIGQRFGWSKWIEDLWKCLTLLAEILREQFSTFYPLSVDILFHSLESECIEGLEGSGKITSFQVHGVLKTNLQILSLQKLGLLPSHVEKVLHFDSPVSQLRLHPNPLVTGSSAATYIFLLQHLKKEIVQQAMALLIEELCFLKKMLRKSLCHGYTADNITVAKTYSKDELSTLIKFDLKVLLSCVSSKGNGDLITQTELGDLHLQRSEKLVSFIIKDLNPFDSSPICTCLELQVNVIKSLRRLAHVEFWSQWSIWKIDNQVNDDAVGGQFLTNSNLAYRLSALVVDYMRKYGLLLIRALNVSLPLSVKLLSLEWIQEFCEGLLVIYENSAMDVYFNEAFACAGIFKSMVLSMLNAAYDCEPKVRANAAQALKLLLQTRLINPAHYSALAEIILEKLGDPDINIKDAFVRLLSHVLPGSLYACGTHYQGDNVGFGPNILMLGNNSNLHWKQAFALKQVGPQFHSQQLVSVMSYISQRWKVSLSFWIQCLIHMCWVSNNKSPVQVEESGPVYIDDLWRDIEADESAFKTICSGNNLAGAWWAVQEAARYCIATRLRTNLGGPTQTFAALERMLLDTAHVIQLDGEQTDDSLNIIGSSGAHLLPMKLLLNFVEALKKNAYNAYEGSVVLPHPLRQSILFFRANKKVCEEWFSRICEPMMNAGLALQCHDASIQYCSLRLEELKLLVNSALKEKSRAHVSEHLHSLRLRYLPDILRILRHMSLALCRNHEADALNGLRKWVSLVFSPFLTYENHPQMARDVSEPFSWIGGLVYQAEGRYEKAAAYFTNLLRNENSLNMMGSDGVQFVIARIIESYSAISDWKSLESWLSELHISRARHAGKSFSGALTTAGNEINSIQALAHFDEGNLQAAWASLDLTPKTSSEITLDPKLASQRSEQMLLQALLLQAEGNVDKVPTYLQKARSMLDEPLAALPLDGLAQALPYSTQLHCIFAFEEIHNKKDGKDKSLRGESIFSPCIQSPQRLINGVHQDCCPWLKVLRVYQSIFPTSRLTLKFGMELLRLARKQGNILLANRLKNYLSDNIYSCSDMKFQDVIISNLQYQGILLSHAENKFEDAFMNLWSFLDPTVAASSSIVLDYHVSVLKAKACLKLSKWLRMEYPGLNLSNILLKMFESFREANASSRGRDQTLFSDENSRTTHCLGTLIEEMVGTTTKLSTQICGSMGKSWLSYASWCFHLAANSVFATNAALPHSCSFSHVIAEELQPERFKLTYDEINSVESAILQLFHNETNAKLSHNEDKRNKEDISIHSREQQITEDLRVNLVRRVVGIIEAAVQVLGTEDSSSSSLFASVTSQLVVALGGTLAEVEDTHMKSVVDKLIDIWWSLRKRRVSLFGHAASGYIQYLSYSSSFMSSVECSRTQRDLLKQKTAGNTLRAMLHVLHILLNYGAELNDMLENSLPKVPLLPWQEVTPQLFARLSSHPEEVVRKQLEGLLMMLAKLSPWSVVYPTLVDVNAYDEKPSEELLHIKSCLSDLYPRLFQDVQLMINELGNVTVLWEELWLSTLQDLHMDVAQRISVLKEEAVRIAENVTLSHSEKNKINAAKYTAMMAPIVVALERRLASTSRKAETPHENWFHQEYGEQLKSAISAFKTPPASTAALGEVWRPFDNIAASLASYQRKSSISLREVAPHLGILSSSDVPMPGLENQVPLSESDTSLTSQLHGIVTISSFLDEVSIISTKTRPKKIAMLGSDGKKYTYLLKGREDLRLDARIMQLLQAINTFLISSPESCGKSVGIRHYSVTPISGRAGLIQWVENVTSIYSIFKSWQNRAQLAQPSAINPDDKSNLVRPVPRPSDMFYGKIIPALKEKGIRRVISRRDWPHDVKRKVLLDLMKDVPKQLLYQEIWCASEGFQAFSSKLRRYSGSVAAMSMVGHILGLGDRHLDNILMDFCSGDVVHIDYNVCFDKGQRLKVPEIVPFRLTQTIEAALGLTGVEGSFRANCEATLGVLKKNKDILLMLLEVFVWDPLIEWTRGNFHDDAAIGGEERKGMELAVSLSLFASRVQEIRIPLQEHHDLLLATLPSVGSALERFAGLLNQYEHVSASFYQADQERSKLARHETLTKSVVAEATSNSEKIQASFELQAREFAQAKAIVSEKTQETSTWVEQHGRILDALRRNLVSELAASIKLSGAVEALSLTSAVLAAGVPLTIVPEPTQAQCHDIDREVSQLVSELDDGFSSAVTALQSYSLALQRLLPLNYLTTSAVHCWAHVLQLSAHALSADVLSLARRQASEVIAKAQTVNLETVIHDHTDLCLKAQSYAADIEKLEGEYTELNNSIQLGGETKAKDLMLSDFWKCMQSAGILKREDILSDKSKELKYDISKGTKLAESNERKEKALAVLQIAVGSVYEQVKQKLCGIFGDPTEGIDRNMLQSDYGIVCDRFEEQVEKCMLLGGLMDDIRRITGREAPRNDPGLNNPSYSEGHWLSIFQTILLCCKKLVREMTEAILPDMMRTAVLFNSDVMDAYGFISQIRSSIDMVLEQLVEVKLERESLIELEQNYFVKVGFITEQQLVLEEAAMKGRDHLSWEEAEELASQEEACRAQLSQLHQNWNQREIRNSSLMKREVEIKDALISLELQFQSCTNAQELSEPHVMRRKELLTMLAKPFTELESLDAVLSSVGCSGSPIPGWAPSLMDLKSSRDSISEHIWAFGDILSGHSFIIWKLCNMDSFLDSCIHNTTSPLDQSLGFEQLLYVAKKKLEVQLQERLASYLKERVATVLLHRLDEEKEKLGKLSEAAKWYMADQVKKGYAPVEKVQLMLEEYCNARETARAARTAASIMKRQISDLKESLCRTSLEIVQMEWMHDTTLKPSENIRVMCSKFMNCDDNVYTIILNLRRPKLLETMKSAVSKIAGSLEGLQACELNSLTAEGQLERAMAWACGGPTSSVTGNLSSKASNIPPEFHDHLMRRQQLLWEFREKALNVIKVCMSLLEFEASRDGILGTYGETNALRTGDCRTWQQANLNALTMLEVAYHTYTRTEQEWKHAQSNTEAASNNLFSAKNELYAASLRAKSASDDLQNTVLAMRDCAYEASVALCAFSRVSKGHTALTSETGSMLEEVLAIGQELQDVQSLGKEAAAIHGSLLQELSKVHAVLAPLESVMSKDVTAMAEAMSAERETEFEVFLIHGQAIYQSYCSRVKEACQNLKPLVPSILSSVKGLYSILARLAQTASLHAGNLNKALEGIGESQEAKSRGLHSLESNASGDDPDLVDKEEGDTAESDSSSTEEILNTAKLTVLDKGYLSPPDTIRSSSSESDLSCVEAASATDAFEGSADLLERLSSDHNDVKDSQTLLSSSQSDTHEASNFGMTATNEVDIGSVATFVSQTCDEAASVQSLDGNLDSKFVGEDEASFLHKEATKAEDREASPQVHTRSRTSMSKNAYALSVLRRIEMKLDGRDVSDNRRISIPEQVDYLLKQATSIDNLCNMYEGWTPWI